LDPLQEPISAPEFSWQPRPKFQSRIWLHVLLFALTVASTTFVGAIHYAAFQADYLPARAAAGPLVPFLIRGLWYSATIIGILGCHELGHYFACRYYDVDASLPFFIPFPFLSISGTLGAVIRIREPIPRKHMLFDIGIAGPIAGFLVAVPAMFIGVALSHVAVVPPDFVGQNLGEPLLFKIAAHLIWGAVPDGYSINMHPMAFAAWFGLLATVWNLFPAGQLDGGHLSYALLGRRSTWVTLATLVAAAALSYYSIVWMGLTIMMTIMLFTFGPRHPPVIDEDAPLDRVRIWLAVFALAIFVLSFSASPISDITGR